MEHPLYRHFLPTFFSVFAVQVGEHTIKLQKNHYRFVQNVGGIEKIMDNLITNDVLTPDDHTEINSLSTPAAKNRKLLEKIRSSRDFTLMIEALREDPVNTELCQEIETTEVTAEDIEKLESGKCLLFFNLVTEEDIMKL